MHKREQPPFVAFIGIDWADKKHDVCLWVPGVEKRERVVLEHSPRAIKAWADELRGRFGGAPIAVALELAQGPIVSALLEHDFFVLFPVQPSMLARYRLAFTPSRAKDDPTDAELALELLLRHPDRLERLEPESPAMRSLRRLVEARRSLVEDRTRLTNRITSALKAYFPQVLGWFRDKEAKIFADFLERWPTLQAAQRARRDTLSDFFRAGNVRYAATICAGSFLSYWVLVPLFGKLGAGSQQPIFAGRPPLAGLGWEDLFFEHVRYIGIGGIFAAGVLSILKLSPVMVQALRTVGGQVRRMLRGQLLVEALVDIQVRNACARNRRDQQRAGERDPWLPRHRHAHSEQWALGAGHERRNPAPEAAQHGGH